MKGGYLDGEVVDILVGKNIFKVYKSERIDKKNIYGIGCILFFVIIFYLVLGYEIIEVVNLSKIYIIEVIKRSFDIGYGVGLVYYFYKFE